MRALLSLSLLLMMWTATLKVQSSIQVMHDNSHVRVLTTTLLPHQPTGLQEHHRHRIWIYLDSGQITQTTASGNVRTLEFRAGDVQWMPATGRLVSENITPRPVELVEIELKGKPQAAVVIPDLDPVKVDPKHWTLVFENDHVRVARVRFGPLENGVRHQHVRNYVVVYMNQHAKGNRGEVNLHLDEGTTTHVENNPLNHAVERIAVELK